MDLERFQHLLSQPQRTQSDLVQMMRNAIGKGQPELARLAEEALDTRFPDWERPARRGAGPKQTLVRWREAHFHASTSKDAYLWLLERFIQTAPGVMAEESWDLLLVDFGHGRRYFARTPRDLFPGTPHLAEVPSYFHRLSNGWVVNLDLDNPLKERILSAFSKAAGLRRGSDWEWKVLG